MKGFDLLIQTGIFSDHLLLRKQVKFLAPNKTKPLIQKKTKMEPFRQLVLSDKYGIPGLLHCC